MFPEFVEEALRTRPDLLGMQDSRDAALRFVRAENALRYPNLSAIGSAGIIPIRDHAV